MDEDVKACVAFRATSKGRRGERAERVAVVRCWFGVRRHALRAASSTSGSGICEQAMLGVFPLGMTVMKTHLYACLELCLQLCDCIDSHVDI
jgi:hypothetical protein